MRMIVHRRSGRMERHDGGAAREGNDVDANWVEGANHSWIFTDSDAYRSSFRLGTATLTLRGDTVSQSLRGSFGSRSCGRSTVVLGTEKALAEAIKLSGIPREEIWITTKLPYVPLGYCHYPV